MFLNFFTDLPLVASYWDIREQLLLFGAVGAASLARIEKEMLLKVGDLQLLFIDLDIILGTMKCTYCCLFVCFASLALSGIPLNCIFNGTTLLPSVALHALLNARFIVYNLTYVSCSNRHYASGYYALDCCAFAQVIKDIQEQLGASPLSKSGDGSFTRTDSRSSSGCYLGLTKFSKCALT